MATWPGSLSAAPFVGARRRRGRDQGSHGCRPVDSPELGLLLGRLFLKAPHLLLRHFEAPAHDEVLAMYGLDGRFDAGVGRLFEQGGPLSEPQPFSRQPLAERLIDRLELLEPGLQA